MGKNGWVACQVCTAIPIDRRQHKGWTWYGNAQYRTGMCEKIPVSSWGASGGETPTGLGNWVNQYCVHSYISGCTGYIEHQPEMGEEVTGSHTETIEDW